MMKKCEMYNNRLKEQEVIPEILMKMVDIELKLNGIATSMFLTLEKLHEAKLALFTLRRIIQGANSNISSNPMANSRQLTLHDFGLN